MVEEGENDMAVVVVLVAKEKVEAAEPLPPTELVIQPTGAASLVEEDAALATATVVVAAKFTDDDDDDFFVGVGVRISPDTVGEEDNCGVVVLLIGLATCIGIARCCWLLPLLLLLLLANKSNAPLVVTLLLVLIVLLHELLTLA